MKNIFEKYHLMFSPLGYQDSCKYWKSLFVQQELWIDGHGFLFNPSLRTVA